MATAQEIEDEFGRIASRERAFREQIRNVFEWIAIASASDSGDPDFQLGAVHGYVQAMRAVLFPNEEE